MAFLDLLSSRIVVAPMAGGPSTPELVIAASRAGAPAFLAAGYKTAASMMAEVAAVRAVGVEVFGVNVFVPGVPCSDAEDLVRYLKSVGAAPEDGTWDDDGFVGKVTALLADPPPVVSFTFGCPEAAVISALRDAGTFVVVTVTSPAEAMVAAAAGADALCVQGLEAGAHRGTFLNADASGQDYGLLALVGAVGSATALPLIAAGGIMSPGQVRAVVAAGAVAAQCGTAFLRCPESGAHPLHKAALADPRYTATTLTRAFSGRPARGLVNQFVLDHRDAPAAYPEINNATRPLRAAAAARGDIERMSLWAGQGFRSATDLPAGEVVSLLTAGSLPIVQVRIVRVRKRRQPMKAVRFDEYGAVDVLRVVAVPNPVPGPGQVLVQVKAAGINPGESKIRNGSLHARWPATFPSGEGSDLAGVVAGTGPGVTAFSAGDEVIGFTHNRASHAEYVLVEAGNLTPKPAGVPWPVAGALFVAGCTAYAAVRAVALAEGDTVVVSGAAGGVGSIAVQLARRTGATVIGIAGGASHGWLREHGVIPVAYGEGAADRIRAAAEPSAKVDAFIDTYGADYVELALGLGVAPDRIDTIVRFDAAERFGVKTDGNMAGGSAHTLAELARLIAAGELEVPVAATFPLDQVQDAYRRLEKGHVLGKIVLIP